MQSAFECTTLLCSP